MSKVKNEHYVVIAGWMVNELNLKGNELLVYAIIYGFSQEEGHTFHGSLQYLADWINSTKQGVMKNLKSLLDKGLIARKDNVINGVNFVEYYTTELHGGIQHSLPGYATEFNGGMQLSLPNNIAINNIEDNSRRNNKGRFTPPTVDEVRAYCKERGNNVDPESFVDFYASKGWMVGKNSMRDWKAAVRTWERGRNDKPKQQGSVHYDVDEIDLDFIVG